jgi:hypothetical protein
VALSVAVSDDDSGADVERDGAAIPSDAAAAPTAA